MGITLDSLNYYFFRAGRMKLTCSCSVKLVFRRYSYSYVWVFEIINLSSVWERVIIVILYTMKSQKRPYLDSSAPKSTNTIWNTGTTPHEWTRPSLLIGYRCVLELNSISQNSLTAPLKIKILPSIWNQRFFLADIFLVCS